MTKLYVVVTEDSRSKKEIHCVYAQEPEGAAMHFKKQKQKTVVAVVPHQYAVIAILDAAEGGE